MTTVGLYMLCDLPAVGKSGLTFKFIFVCESFTYFKKALASEKRACIAHACTFSYECVRNQQINVFKMLFNLLSTDKYSKII